MVNCPERSGIKPYGGIKMKIGQIRREMESRKGLKTRLIMEGLGVGTATGTVILLSRIAISKLQVYFRAGYAWGTGSWPHAAAILAGLAALGLLSGLMVKKEPLISGSGIPQVEGQLAGKIRPCWYRVLFYKFFGGLLTLGAGLTLGREGPSVQMGAAAGEGIADLLKRPDTEKKYLITSGAAAGLASAFHAPMAGVVFALEEVHQNFSAIALVSAMAAAIAADFVSSTVLGLQPVLPFDGMKPLPLAYYWLIILLGVFLGLAGVLFNKAILLSKSLYAKINCPVYIKTMVPFVLTGAVCMLMPELFGSGDSVIEGLAHSTQPVWYLAVLLAAKLLLLMVCFGSGLPGGIFFPLLVLGALYGQIFGAAAQSFLGMPAEYVICIVILSMAAHFSSIVRAPVTGILLVSEMTGSFAFFLPLTLVSLCAYLTADLLRSKPIYESLLDLILIRPSKSSPARTRGRILWEFAVEHTSPADGKRVKDMQWPEHFLLVSIKRGQDEVIPDGNTLLTGGDYAVGLLPAEELDVITEKMSGICRTRI